MPYAKRTIRCYVCEQPYVAQKPWNKTHRPCADKLKRQRAAEERAARTGVITKVEPAPEPAPEPTPTTAFDWDAAGAEIESYLDEIFRKPATEAPCIFVNPDAIDFDDLDLDSPGATFPIRGGNPRDAVFTVPANDEKKPLKIFVIPDTQVKPGVPLEHFTWLGQYAAEKRPDVIVHLGDHFDMPSLSSYDKGKKSFEGRRYTEDIAAGIKALHLFEYQLPSDYKPRKIYLLGNHEDRITRAIEESPHLDGTLSLDHVKQPFIDEGWEVHDFLKIVEVAGIKFSHYFVSGAMNKAVSSAAALLREWQSSAIQGHNQVWQMAVNPRTHRTAIFAGAFYQHTEGYLTPQGNDHKRQILVLHEAHDGQFDLMQVSLDFLRRRFS